jgi:hypothetical protein
MTIASAKPSKPEDTTKSPDKNKKLKDGHARGISTIRFFYNAGIFLEAAKKLNSGNTLKDS